MSLCGFPTAILFYACSSVCRELSVKFVRFYKNAISRVFLGRNFKKPLAISVPKWYVVSNKSETWIHPLFGAATSAPHTLLFLTLLFSSFTFLSFTLPVPQGTRKAMTHLHGLSLFLLPAGGQSTSRQSTALQDDVPQLLFPVPPQKVCLNKHPCFFLTSLCMRVILISVN